MNFRRIPFQFSAVDPAERQLELQKRFGLPTTNKMLVELGKLSNMDGLARESNSTTNSPRLQHRVPIFTEEPDMPDKSSMELKSNNVDGTRKPHVRVIPIQVDCAENLSVCREGTYASSPGITNGVDYPDDPLHHTISPPTTKRYMQDYSPVKIKRHSEEPQTCNIPISVDDKDNLNGTNNCTMMPNLNAKPGSLNKIETNGCNVSKTSNKTNVIPTSEQIPVELNFNISLKKIADIHQKLQSYERQVECFSGTLNDKRYGFLDEMLTRLMLDLDNVETMGNEKVRLKRKVAIKEVQACIDRLESKLAVADETHSVLSKNSEEVETGCETESTMVVEELSQPNMASELPSKNSDVINIKCKKEDSMVIEESSQPDISLKLPCENSEVKNKCEKEDTMVIEKLVPHSSVGTLDVAIDSQPCEKHDSEVTVPSMK